MKILIPFAALLASLLITVRAAGQTKSDITVTVTRESGTYSLTSALHHWKFQGTIGQPVSQLETNSGRDTLGMYKQISFGWKSNNVYVAKIRWYQELPVVIFSLTTPNGAKGQRPVSFPSFTNFPSLPYHFSYHNHIFALPEFYLEETSTPWMLYNDSAEACIISPASDFMVSLMTNNDSTTITSGLNPEVTNLPSNFTHSTIVVTGKGIRSTWDDWGNALRALYNRKRPSNDCDPLLKYFGFWTDNGSDYYYNYDTTKGYAETLISVAKYYKDHGIPLGYMQLDSWWYEKSRYNVYGKLGADKKKPELPNGLWNRSGGLLEYKADPSLFPNGLSGFQKKLGVPLVTHNRWIDSTSAYHNEYKISGLSAIDPGFWKHIMRYLKSSGVIAYEQDWMNYIYRLNPAMAADLSIGNAFTDGMANAAKENGINMQYCMALPRYYMQGLKYNNLTTVRPSGDRFKPERWKNFIFTSQLAYQMGIWPWSDVFKSGEINNMIVSVLSAGAVGTGDKLGSENKANILMACRTDGVLVKPDVPLQPMDKDYIQLSRGENKPLLGYTYTKHGDITTGYVFAFADGSTTSSAFSFKPEDIGVKATSVVFDPLHKTLQLVQRGNTFDSELPESRYVYYIIAPITSSGIALLGDAEKIVSTGKKRIAHIISSGKKLYVKVLFAKGESAITLYGYAAHFPVSDVGKITWNNDTHLFTLALKNRSKMNEAIVTLSCN